MENTMKNASLKRNTRISLLSFSRGNGRKPGQIKRVDSSANKLEKLRKIKLNNNTNDGQVPGRIFCDRPSEICHRGG